MYDYNIAIVFGMGSDKRANSQAAADQYFQDSIYTESYFYDAYLSCIERPFREALLIILASLYAIQHCRTAL